MTTAQIEELIEAHQAELYRYLRFLGADGGTAREVLQDVFIAAFRAGRHPDLAHLRQRLVWLRAIARNLFLKHCRSRRRSRLVSVDPADLERAEGVWESDFAVEDGGFERFEALRECRKQLPEKQARLLRMRYVEKRSREDMAMQLGMAANSVKSALRRVRRALADCIRGRLREVNS